MKLSTLMSMLVIFHTMISMQKMVSSDVTFYCVASLPFYFTFYQTPLKNNLPKLLMTSAEHFNPLLDQIAKLEEALYNIQFEQHWLEAQTDRQAIGTIRRTGFLFLYSKLDV